MGKVLKGTLVLPDGLLPGGLLRLEGDRIAEITPDGSKTASSAPDIRDFGEALIGPGLIDLHVHGAAGRDAMDGRGDSLEIMARHLSRCGVTGFLAATISASVEKLLEVICDLKRAAVSDLPAGLLGVYIEGPFISGKAAGMHDTEAVCGLSGAAIDRIFLELEGMPALISLAPEAGNNMSFIGAILERGGVAALGHSDASYDQAMESFRRGISHSTHLFNAMKGFHHREPGAVGAVLDADEVTAEIIADGIHVHPSAVRLAVARKGIDGICLVTDSNRAAGLGDGSFTWGGAEVVVRGGEARLGTRGILAGSVLTLNVALRNVLNWTGLPLDGVFRMASLTPAEILGVEDDVGSLAVGKRADLAILDREFHVLETIFRGRTVHRRGRGTGTGDRPEADRD